MLQRFIILCFAVMLSACNLNQQTGTLSVSITDSPVTDAKEVYLAVSGITVHGPGGIQNFDAPGAVDGFVQFPLMTLAGDTSALLFSEIELAAGHYQWIRLDIVTDRDGDTYLERETGGVHELSVPSVTGLKLVRGFDVPANGNISIILDVDLQKSLVFSNNNYHLKPVIRMIDESEVGHIAGTLTETLVSNSGCSDFAVYLMAGTSTTPVDISPDAEPEMVSHVNLANGNTFAFGFVIAGDYSLALACNPVDDINEVDSLNFIQAKNAIVEVGETTQVSFDVNIADLD